MNMSSYSEERRFDKREHGVYKFITFDGLGRFQEKKTLLTEEETLNLTKKIS